MNEVSQVILSNSKITLIRNAETSSTIRMSIIVKILRKKRKVTEKNVFRAWGMPAKMVVLIAFSFLSTMV